MFSVNEEVVDETLEALAASGPEEQATEAAQRPTKRGRSIDDDEDHEDDDENDEKDEDDEGSGDDVEAEDNAEEGVHSGLRSVAKEWMVWCGAGPGESVFGVVMADDKEIYDPPVVVPAVADLFLDYYSRRPRRWNGKLEIGTTVGIEAMRMAIRSLNKLQRAQRPQYGDLECIRISGETAKILKRLSDRDDDDVLRIEKRTDYLSAKQHDQLSSIGLFDESPCPGTRGMVARLLHVLRHTFSWRNDDVRKAKLEDIFVLQTPLREGPQPCFLLAVSNKNGEERVDVSAAMRHSTQPQLCLQFQIALAIFEIFAVEKEAPPTWLLDKDTKRSPDFHSFHIVPGLDQQKKLDARTSLSAEAMSKNCVFDLIENPLSADQKKLDLSRRGHSQRHGFYTLEEARSSIMVLTDAAYERIRSTAGFPTRSGYFYLLRNIHLPPKRLTSQVYASLLDSHDPQMTDLTTQQFVAVLEHLAGLLCQDLAVLKDRMSKHAVFETDPFKDDTYGFETFRKDLLAKMRNEGASQLRRTAEAAHLRGDEKCADYTREVLTSVLAMLDRKKEPTSPRLERMYRQIDEIHQVLVRLRDDKQQNSAPALLPVASNQAPLLFGQRPVVVSDPSTWPRKPQHLPPFALATTLFDKPPTIQTLADEYFRGLDGGAPLKYLDQFYGPGPRPGGGRKNQPFSWRSKEARDPDRKSRAFNQNFERRKIYFDYLDKLIKDGSTETEAVAFLQAQVDQTLKDGQPSNWSAILSIEKDLKKTLRPEIYEKHRQRATQSHVNRQQKQKIGNKRQRSGDDETKDNNHNADEELPPSSRRSFV